MSGTMCDGICNLLKSCLSMMCCAASRHIACNLLVASSSLSTSSTVNE